MNGDIFLTPLFFLFISISCNEIYLVQIESDDIDIDGLKDILSADEFQNDFSANIFLQIACGIFCKQIASERLLDE